MTDWQRARYWCQRRWALLRFNARVRRNDRRGWAMLAYSETIGVRQRRRRYERLHPVTARRHRVNAMPIAEAMEAS